MKHSIPHPIPSTSHLRYHKKKAIDFDAIAKSYVAFIAGISHIQEKIVVGVFPSSWQVVALIVWSNDFINNSAMSVNQTCDRSDEYLK